LIIALGNGFFGSQAKYGIVELGDVYEEWEISFLL
jgi:hypothetical protein